MSNFIQDLRYAARLLAKNPGFALVAVLTLALGIGANTTIFTWVNGFLLNGFPGVPDADRLLAINFVYRGGGSTSFSYPDFDDFRMRADKIDIVGMDMEAMNLKLGDEGERIWGKIVTGNFFEGLGVRPALGRGFQPDEWKSVGSHPVVVISHALWQRKFAGDPGIVGRTITLNNTQFHVVGVTPEDFRGAYVGLAFDAYVPMQMFGVFSPGGGSRMEQRGNHWFDGLAKLKPGVSLEEAQAQLAVVSKQLSDAYPDTNRDMVGTLYPLYRSPYGATSVMGPVLIILSGVVGLVLLIACANVANLLLAKASARRKEIAIRVSLGASRGQLVRQLLTESMLLAFAGGALGVAFAFWSWDLLLSFMPSADLPIALTGNNMDWLTLSYTFALSLVTGLLFGLAPALEASRRDVVSTLKDEGSVGGSKGRLRNSLVVAQVSLSLLLLVSAGLLLRSLANAQSLTAGFQPKGVWLGSVDLFPSGYTPETGREFQRQLLQRVSTLPGVEVASLARRVPLGFGGSSTSSIRVEGFTAVKDEDRPFASINNVSPNYFRSMGIEILRGRDFNAQDLRGAQNVVVINDVMVQRYWKDREPLGGVVHLGDTAMTVVGVVRSHKYRSLAEAPRPFLYLPLEQWYRSDVTLHVRTQGEPGALSSSLRSAFRELDATLPLFNVTTLDNHIGAATFAQRLGGYMLAAFGALALLLAAIGIYGVMSFSVSQRTREIGIRMALGAGQQNILGMVLGQGAFLIGIGVALGLGVALTAAAWLRSLLLNVSPRDPLTFVVVPVILAAVALLATLIPARRATRVDPLVALRHD